MLQKIYLKLNLHEVMSTNVKLKDKTIILRFLFRLFLLIRFIGYTNVICVFFLFLMRLSLI